MKTLNDATPDHSGVCVKPFRYAICLMLFSLSWIPSAWAEEIPPASQSDQNTSAILAAIEGFQVQVTARMDALRDLINQLWGGSATNSNLTAAARQPNVVLFNPDNAFEFAQDTTGETGTQLGASPVHTLVEDAVQKAAALKLAASLETNSQTQDARRQVLLQPLTSDADATINMLDAQKLLGTLSYASNAEQNNAERIVALFSDFASPVGAIDLTKLKESGLATSSDGMAYRAKVFTLSAIRSLLIGNLYQSLNMRTPIKHLGMAMGMHENDVSLAQALEYMASRRLRDPEWYTQINTAPPVVVQREVAYLLAEMQWQLHLLHKDNERILQTMTAATILNLRSMKAMSDTSERNLQQTLSGSNTAPVSSGTTIDQYQATGS